MLIWLLNLNSRISMFNSVDLTLMLSLSTHYVLKLRSMKKMPSQCFMMKFTSLQLVKSILKMVKKYLLRFFHINLILHPSIETLSIQRGSHQELTLMNIKSSYLLSISSSVFRKIGSIKDLQEDFIYHGLKMSLNLISNSKKVVLIS